MEVKDLMVGDWVSVSGTPMQVACRYKQNRLRGPGGQDIFSLLR